MSDPREEKLPGWARKLLADERQRAARAEEKLQAHLETVEPSRISYGDYENPIYIPDRWNCQTIRFDLGHEPNHRMHDEISVGLREDHDGVRYLDINGNHGIVVHPSASNLVRIYQGD